MVRHELESLRVRARREAEWRDMAPELKAAAIVSDVILGAPKSGVASGDLSALGQQGALAALTDTASWLKAWAPQIRAAWQLGYTRVAAEIRAGRYGDFAEMQMVGLELPTEELDPGEEQFVSRLMMHMPGLLGKQQRASMRTYAAALSVLRAQMYSEWVTIAEQSNKGKPLSLASRKLIAESVNTFTGRGAKYIAGAEPISKLFFALRYRLSQFEVAGHLPLLKAIGHYYQTRKAGEPETGPMKLMARKYARAWTTQAAVMGVLAVLFEALSPEDENGKKLLRLELNPWNVDFGRVLDQRKNETVAHDLIPPALRSAAWVLRMGTQQHQTRDGKWHKGAYSQRQDIGQWAVSGLTPVLSMLTTLTGAWHDEDHEAYSKSYDLRKPEGWANTALGFTPISFQKHVEIVKSKDLNPTEKVVLAAVVLAASSGVRQGGMLPSMPDTVERELKRTGAEVHQPTRTLQIGEERIRIDDAVWTEYRRRRRDRVVDAVQAKLADPDYQEEPKPEQAKELASAIKSAELAAGKAAKGQMLLQDEAKRLKLPVAELVPRDPALHQEFYAQMFENLRSDNWKNTEDWRGNVSRTRPTTDAEKRKMLEEWMKEQRVPAGVR